MLKHKQNSSIPAVSGAGITQSMETDSISHQNQPQISQFSILDSKPYKSGKSQESKRKSVVSDDHGDHNRYVERDFMQLSGNSSKLEVEIIRDKKPKLETLDLSLALPDDVSSSLAASNQLQFLNSEQHSVSMSNNNTQTSFSTDFTAGGSMSFSCSHPFSHNPSCSMTRNSTGNYESSKIWNGGEGTNGSVHSPFRPRQSGDCSKNLDLSRPEKILQEIVSEPIPIVAKEIVELSDETVESAKGYLKKLIESPETRDELVRLQLRLERRSDLTRENLSKANRNQLEILVSVRTNLGSFLSVQTQTRLPTNELIEIFLYERCKNVDCKRPLPVADCDCKICAKKDGFCSECMCSVCLNFDCANNTCGWVGCDGCSHWCHATCGLRKNLIKPGPSLEVQFRCIGCGHASDMFGFVKDVFKSCAEEWSLETLMKELDCVRKIFRASSDFKGKELYSKAGEMISNLGNKVMSHSDVCSFILQFFNCKSLHKYRWRLRNSHIKFTINRCSTISNDDSNNMMMMIKDEWSVKSSKKERFDSVESLVRIKEAEARMFQEKADEARKEAEGYKRMIGMKMEKLDEEYTEKLSKLCLNESEERKNQKVEEIKVLEIGHLEYYKMKMRMQAEIAGLLQRMENTKKQWVYDDHMYRGRTTTSATDVPKNSSNSPIKLTISASWPCFKRSKRNSSVNPVTAVTIAMR
ncbi:hypothetical protein OSB04_008878 [Centaurea solstitialis]|uniref:Uncharacterized protein n=1 Tax=Centaurea solstitialis TaxID=347529 RepID=A0AA38TV52_9ASTR|nr:hypothetical protein OSB04_008878 [Centaurea solstitialis]